MKSGKSQKVSVTCLTSAFLGSIFAIFVFHLYFYNRFAFAAGDPVALANTYIIFTTLIFAGHSAVLVIGGMWLARQFAEAKEEQTNRILKELKKDMTNNTIRDSQETVPENKKTSSFQTYKEILA